MEERQHPADEQEINLRSYAKVLWRRWMFVVAAVVITVAASIIGIDRRNGNLQSALHNLLLQLMGRASKHGIAPLHPSHVCQEKGAAFFVQERPGVLKSTLW